MWMKFVLCANVLCCLHLFTSIFPKKWIFGVDSSKFVFLCYLSFRFSSIDAIFIFDGVDKANIRHFIVWILENVIELNADYFFSATATTFEKTENRFAANELWFCRKLGLSIVCRQWHQVAIKSDTNECKSGNRHSRVITWDVDESSSFALLLNK